MERIEQEVDASGAGRGAQRKCRYLKKIKKNIFNKKLQRQQEQQAI